MLRRFGSFALASAALVGATVAGTPSDQPARSSETIPGEQRLIELYRDYRDTVVKVKYAVKTVDENGKEHVALTVQSGFYIDAKGTVLTNAVPTQKGPRLRIEKDGLQLLAVPLASDPRSNIALIQVAKPPPGIRYIDLSQPASAPRIGSLAYAITSPLDLAPTPKLGIVTGQESSFGEIEFPCTYTRIGISSGPAEGGSPVFGSDGALIGLSVASLPDVASSYVVPTRSLQHIVAQLRKNGTVFHPKLPVQISERVNPNTLQRSLEVSALDASSAAAKPSGLQAGDLILSLQGKAISGINEWRDALFFSPAGQFLSLTIQRGEEQKEIALLLESQ
ncbi:S1C family serine protease [Pelagicoccus sp. SDUM812005]|uniref:S1C family serine protease n=1 Tax=Pelagicoccus sp. SDUM812005 TaxID=3041257 RepID=UPI00280E6508|nr:S1C family serine protease [Pelagicoccus sp. SDUM812005]MDQ8183392.1 S1C family serine protease [Pelagicoccus sp. SDUM812005]